MKPNSDQKNAEVGLGVPAGLTAVIFTWQCVSWNAQLKEKARKFGVAQFQQPIGASLTVAGFVIPLLCGSIAFLIAEAHPPRELIPLVVSVILFILSALAGLIVIFSLIEADETGVLTVTNTRFGGIVAQFVLQLTLLVFAIGCVVGYFLFVFEIPSKKVSATSEASAIFINREHLRLGMTSLEVSSVWGRPNQITDSDGILQWLYISSTGKITVTFSNGGVSKITEEKGN